MANAAPSSVYWVGTDGNVWQKGANGVQNMGAAIKTYNGGFDAANGSGLGSQIADPNPGGGAPAKTNPTTQTTSAPSGTTTSTAPASTFNAPDYISGIQGEYNSAIQGAQQQEAQGGAWRDQNLREANNAFDKQIGLAQSQVANQVNTYNTQEQGVRNQQGMSLAELADQIRGQHQGFLNQLGSVGAGNSSAVGEGEKALAKEQNMNRANIQQQAGTNVANIEAEKQQEQNTLQPYVDQVNAYRQQAVSQILQNYQTLMTQLNQAIGTAQGEEKARLAMYGQQLQDSAGAALDQVGKATQAAIASYGQHPGADVAKNAPSYQGNPLGDAPKAIEAPNVQPGFAATPAAAPTSAPGSAAYLDLLKQQQAGAAA